jgi:hypothetical protein
MRAATRRRGSALRLGLILAMALPAAAASAEQPTAAGFSLATETLGLAYGLAAGSPRISLSASLPLSRRLSIQASPVIAWGGGEGVSSFELLLPAALRYRWSWGSSSPYAAAGASLGCGRFSASGTSVQAFDAGLLAELGSRLPLFSSRIFLEPYAGAAALIGLVGGRARAWPAGYGGLRLGFVFGDEER